jgi:3-hydroxyisobutyrate dehydrogenase-like beta-hydroxyacid dehydrogenase
VHGSSNSLPRSGNTRRIEMVKSDTLVTKPDGLRAGPGSRRASAATPSQRGRSLSNKIGSICIGRMGSAMAANLAAAGRRIEAYVRRPDRMEELVGLGLNATTELACLFDGDIVISVLPDDAAVCDIVFGRKDLGVPGLAAGLRRGAIHLCLSTISTAMASELAAEHERSGQGYVAAPVFGNPEAARAHQLFIIAAGAASDVERCQPLFDVLDQKTFAVGTEPSHANLIKLLGNMMTATTLEMLGEVVAVALKRGLDPKSFVDVMTSTMFGGRAHKLYGDKIVARSYAPGFVLPPVLKDTRLALAEAEAAGAPMPSVNVVHDRLITGIVRGYARPDRGAGSRAQQQPSGPDLTIGGQLAPAASSTIRRKS